MQVQAIIVVALRSPMPLTAVSPSHFSTADYPMIWWSNGIFFVFVHISTAVGVWLHPFHAVPRATLVLAFVLFQAGELA